MTTAQEQEAWEAMHGNTLTIGQEIAQEQADEMYSFAVDGLAPFAECRDYHAYCGGHWCQSCGVMKCLERGCTAPMMRGSEGGFCAEHESE